MRKSLYRFPSNKRAECASLCDQIIKLHEETNEVSRAFLDDESDARIIEETWDVIQTAEGILRKFPTWMVAIGFARVKLKSWHRGDYGRRRRWRS